MADQKDQQVMWTVLPNGVVGSGAAAKLRFSVFVSPKLRTNIGLPRPTLSQFPDFLDWPKALAGVKFSVQFGGGAPIAVEPLKPPDDPPPSDLWKSIFAADTYVKPYEFPKTLATAAILSYPVGNVLARIKETYGHVAVQSPREIPRLTPQLQERLPRLHGLLTEIALEPETKQRLTSAVAALRARGAQKIFVPQAYHEPGRLVPRSAGPGAVAAENLGVPGVTAAAVDFHQAQAFHARRIVERSRPSLAGLLQGLDFHRIVTALGQYPAILRRLGLVLDFEVPMPAVTGATTVAVAVQWTPAVPTENICPRTHCKIEAGRFVAVEKSADSDTANGWVKLNDETRFEIGQVDVDGAALKMLSTASRLKRFGTTLVPAAVRTGLAPGAIQAAAAAQTQQGQQAGGGQAAPGAVVRPRLVRPAVTAAVGGAAAAKPEEEEVALPALRNAGIWVARVERQRLLAASLSRSSELDAAVSERKDKTPELWAEDLIRGYRVDVWDETTKKWYSLCQRVGTYNFVKAGKTLTAEDEGWVTMGVAQEDGASGQVKAHEIVFRWEGWSLAAPRPGKPLPPEGAEQPKGDELGMNVVFVPKEGSLPRLRFGREYRMRARVVDLAGNSIPPDSTDASAATDYITYQRYDPLLPPVVIPRNNLKGAEGESVAYLVIRSLNDAPAKDRVPTTAKAERHIIPPQAAQLLAETHGMFDTPENVKGDQATYQLIVSHDGALPEYFEGAQARVPYLPDPLAYGATVQFELLYTGTRPNNAQTLSIPFTGTWPDLQPFRIVVYEPTNGETKLNYDAGQRVLQVPLAKGDTARIKLSCYMMPRLVANMGILRWAMEDIVGPQLRSAPLPMAEKLQIRRQLHDVTALPRYSARLSLAPNLAATATKVSDDATQGRHWMITPHRELILTHATQQPLFVPDLTKMTATKPAFGSTYAELDGELPCSGKSTQKFEIYAEWDEWIDPPGKPGPEQVHGKGRAAELVPDRSSEVLPLGKARHEFHDTKYRRVRYTAVATTRFQECFDRNAIANGTMKITRTSAVKELDVLSSARPAAPKVLYVIPAFGWAATPGAPAGAISRTREGGWLRVYLERPWFSSGDGELLGVVLPQAPPRLTAVAMPIPWASLTEAYTTRWGADPLWQAAQTKADLAPADFPAATATESDLTLEEAPGLRVSVAGHKVEYDPDRQLWYADIQINYGKAYYPFVRLALARYQPKSLVTDKGDCKLSRIVMAEFAQLAPHRAATLTFPDATTVDVTVTGPSYLASKTRQGFGDMYVAVEKQSQGDDPDLGWVPALTEEVRLQANRTTTGDAIWRGQVKLPAPRGSQKFRIVIKEYEWFQTGEQVTLGDRVVRPEDKRLVYAEAMVI